MLICFCVGYDTRDEIANHACQERCARQGSRASSEFLQSIVSKLAGRCKGYKISFLASDDVDPGGVAVEEALGILNNGVEDGLEVGLWSAPGSCVPQRQDRR